MSKNIGCLRKIATPPVAAHNDNGCGCCSVPVAVGQKVRFDPFDGIKGEGVPDLRGPVEGTVETVYHKHRMFLVRYGEQPIRSCFHFSDIGVTVFLGR